MEISPYFAGSALLLHTSAVLLGTHMHALILAGTSLKVRTENRLKPFNHSNNVLVFMSLFLLNFLIRLFLKLSLIIVLILRNSI